MSEAERGAETKMAVDAMADADEAWTKALDDGAHIGGTADELRLTSLLAFGGDHGVTIRWDGTLEPAASVSAPRGLTEGERELVATFREHFPPIDPDSPVSFNRHVVDTLLALVESFDRLSAAPVGLTEDERVTVDWLRDSGDPWDRRVLAIIDRLAPVSPSVDPEEKP